MKITLTPNHYTSGKIYYRGIYKEIIRNFRKHVNKYVQDKNDLPIKLVDLSPELHDAILSKLKNNKNLISKFKLEYKF